MSSVFIHDMVPPDRSLDSSQNHSRRACVPWRPAGGLLINWKTIGVCRKNNHFICEDWSSVQGVCALIQWRPPSGAWFPHVIFPAVWFEYAAARSGQVSGRSLPGAGRRRFRQDPRDHAKDRAPDRGLRLRGQKHCGADLHQQGRDRDAGAHRQAAEGAEAGQAPDDFHLPFARRQNPAPGSQAPGPERPLLDPGQRRLLRAGAGSGRDHRQAADPPHPECDVAVEKRPARPRYRAQERGRRRRGAGGAHLPQLRRHAVGLPGGRFRRPDPAAGGAVPRPRRSARQVAAPAALPAWSTNTRTPIPASTNW